MPFFTAERKGSANDNNHSRYHFRPATRNAQETFRDDTELDTAAFLQKLKAAAQLPKTAAPPPSLYNPVFDQIENNGEEAVVVAPSSKVSGTARSAQVAALEFPNLKVQVVDTQSIAGNLASQRKPSPNI